MSEQQSLTPPGKLRERAAEEIRVILARKRMSAAELARRTDIKQPYLSRRMTGEIAFDLDDLEVIARELNVTVVDLLGGWSQATDANLAMTESPSASDDRPDETPPIVLGVGARMIPTMRRPVRIEMTAPQVNRSLSPSECIA